MLMLEVREGDVISSDPGRMAKITAVQEAAKNGCFARIMSSFISWIARKRETVLSDHAFYGEAMRQDFSEDKTLLARTASIGAELLAGYDHFLDFCNDLHDLDKDLCDQYFGHLHDDLRAVLAEQGQTTIEANPAVIFMSLLREAMAAGRGYLEPRNLSMMPDSPELYGLRIEDRLIPKEEPAGDRGDEKETGEKEQEEPQYDVTSYPIRNGKQIGYWDCGVSFLLAEPALAVVQELAEKSSLQPLPISRKTLGAMLHGLGVLRPKKDDGHYAEKMRFHRQELRVLAIPDEMIFKDWVQKKSATAGMATEPDQHPVDLERLLEA